MSAFTSLCFQFIVSTFICLAFGAVNAFSAEIPLAVKVFQWHYNPSAEPDWLQGKGRDWLEKAMTGWEPCGIHFEYLGETSNPSGMRDGFNVFGWDSTLGRGQRGITRSFIKKSAKVAFERDVAFSPYRKEFRLYPRLLRKVMAHELGHVVGLGHADNCDDVMSFGSNCRGVDPEILPVSPTQNDLKRCQELYQ